MRLDYIFWGPMILHDSGVNAKVENGGILQWDATNN